MAAYGPITTIDPALANSASPYGSDNSVASMLTGNGIPTGTQFQHINDGGFLSALDNIIKYGAIAGGSAIGGLGAAGQLGAGTVGPGASALGGTAGDISAAMGTGAGAVGGGASVGGDLASNFSGGNYVDPLFSGTPEAGVPGATGTFDATAPLTGDALTAGGSGGGLLQSLLGNKDLVNSAIKAIGGLAGGGPAQSQPGAGGAGGATGGAAGSGGGRSFSTFNPGTLGMPEPKVSPLTYNAIQPGQTSPMLLAQVLRGMSG